MRNFSYWLLKITENAFCFVGILFLLCGFCLLDSEPMWPSFACVGIGLALVGVWGLLKWVFDNV